LIFKHGRFGQFIACSEWPKCSYTANEDGTPTRLTKEVIEWDEDGNPISSGWGVTPKERLKRYCPNQKCDGSGLIPLRRKSDNTVVPHAWTYCDCHESNQPEYYRPYPYALKPEDFDFPISHSFYRSLCQEHGWDDPGALETEPQGETQEVKEDPWTNRQWDTVNQLRSEVRHIHKEVMESLEKKRVAKQDKYKYK